MLIRGVFRNFFSNNRLPYLLSISSLFLWHDLDRCTEPIMIDGKRVQQVLLQGYKNAE
jgi:hypothetical protein